MKYFLKQGLNFTLVLSLGLGFSQANAYKITSDNGKSFGGVCANGYVEFTGYRDSDYYKTMSAFGHYKDKSQVRAISKVCDETPSQADLDNEKMTGIKIEIFNTPKKGAKIQFHKTSRKSEAVRFAKILSLKKLMPPIHIYNSISSSANSEYFVRSKPYDSESKAEQTDKELKIKYPIDFLIKNSSIVVD